MSPCPAASRPYICQDGPKIDTCAKYKRPCVVWRSVTLVIWVESGTAPHRVAFTRKFFVLHRSIVIVLQVLHRKLRLRASASDTDVDSYVIVTMLLDAVHVSRNFKLTGLILLSPDGRGDMCVLRRR